MNKEQRIAGVAQIIADIHRMMPQPAFEPETSEQLRLRARRRTEMATAIKLSGGRVNKEFL